jgi:hypothetical protein
MRLAFYPEYGCDADERRMRDKANLLGDVHYKVLIPEGEVV